MAPSVTSAALLLCLATTASASRLNLDVHTHRSLHAKPTYASGKGPPKDGGVCCCKEEACTAKAESESGTPAVYSPAHGLCCKFLGSRCHYWGGYSLKAESRGFCVEPQDVHYVEPQALPSALMPGEAEGEFEPKPNTPAHTVDSYCDMKGHSAVEAHGEERMVDAEERAATAKKRKRDAVITELVKELSRNSLDSMAKDIFSLYVCVRWAPNQEFTRLARDEIETEQLPKDADPYDLYADGSFIPLRCSRNIQVYDQDRSTNETHFKYFEQALLAISDWLEAEQAGEVQKRLVEAEKTNHKRLEGVAKAFDLAPLAKFVAKCPKDVDSRSAIHLKHATVDDMLKNCATAKFWLDKLKDWQTAFPFTSFMSPSKSAAVHAPKKHEQVLVCFGKRVASQLHRRAGGGHLLTDQSAVGCHGFWSFKQSARMLRRTVWLWRPPTCQLAAMELDMKLKLMDAIADMNSKLFDALPAMLLDEVGQMPQVEDGRALSPAGTVGTLGKVSTGIASSIAGAVGWLFGLNKAYQRMGLLLGNTVVKWAVCPLRPLEDAHEERRLDGSLGTEDDVARFYAQQAYSKWTGEGNELPGEVCLKEQGSPVQQTVPRCSACSLGIMQESMPEPYGDEQFVCPVRPLLPAKQQLKVLEDKHDTCFMHMTGPQLLDREWMYRGHTPHKRQYNLTENPPSDNYQSVKVRSWRRAPDSQFGIWRDFVTVARRCTEEEYAATPRWCQEVQIGGPAAQSTAGAIASGVGSGVVTAVTGAGALGGAVLEATGHMQESAPWNRAIGKRMTNWAYGLMKRTEGGARSLYASILGRAKARQGRLYARLFSEVEAGELLHSSSFQKKLENKGSDSKGRARFDRYAITCPCPNFDPDREFRLKYTWAEHALTLARVAKGSFDPKLLADNAAFSVETVGASVLHMRDVRNAWQDSYSILRVGGVGKKMSEWHDSRDTGVAHIVGVDGAMLYDTSIFGLKATYACGTRREMHDLPLDFHSGSARPSGASLAQCVRDGVAKNERLREESPLALFLADEVVVRATFEPLQTCYHESWAKEAPAVTKQVDKDGKEAPKVWGEEHNAVYTGFAGLGQGCEKPSSEVKAVLPKAVRSGLDRSTYRGLFLAKGLPVETLTEVLLDPADVMAEIGA